MINQDAYVLICCDWDGKETVIYPKKIKDNCPDRNNHNGIYISIPHPNFPKENIKYITDFLEAKQWAQEQLGTKYKRICFAKVKEIYSVDFKSEFENRDALS